jgi:sucrose-6-phosphate hydrolase SacC (GH32 family)
VGRNASYTEAECLALCKATKDCGGFVLDAIPGELKSQCKVQPKSGEACCLLKTDCSRLQQKKGDTAVSVRPPPPPPAPPNPLFEQWCPAYHRIHSTNMCDPSGPIQTADGVWHVFDDCTWCTGDHAPFACPWAHYRSTDLLHWTQVPFSVGGCAAPNCGNPFHSTGSLSYTGSPDAPSMIAMNGACLLAPPRLASSPLAFSGLACTSTCERSCKSAYMSMYPLDCRLSIVDCRMMHARAQLTIGYLEGNGGLQTTVTLDPKLETWPNATIVAPHPSAAKGGFRDPARALNVEGSWYVGVGSGATGGAQVLFFKATNGSLSKFEAPFPLYKTSRSFVSNNSVGMFECPDVFKLNGKYVVLTSVEGDTQWLVGTIATNTAAAVAAGGVVEQQLSFTPETGGYSDQGVDYYAAKTGAPAVLKDDSRRLLFAFNGWGGGVTSKACGRYDIIPRELTVKDGFLHIAPVSELEGIRRNVSSSRHSSGSGSGAAGRTLVHSGSQVEVRLNCSLPSSGYEQQAADHPAAASAAAAAGATNITVDVLATSDESQWARYGFSLSTNAFFISSRGFSTTSSKVQTPYTSAPVRAI